MEHDDEEIDKLLGEIPHATSSPPHLEEFEPGDIGSDVEEFITGGGGGDGGAIATTPSNLQLVVQENPPPTRKVITMLSDSCIPSCSSFYSHHLHQSDMQHTQRHQSHMRFLHHNVFDVSRNDSLDQHLADDEQIYHQLPSSDHSLSSTLANLSLHNSSDFKSANQVIGGNGNAYAHHHRLTASTDPTPSDALFPSANSIEVASCGFRLGSPLYDNHLITNALSSPSYEAPLINGSNYTRSERKLQTPTRQGSSIVDWSASQDESRAEVLSRSYFQLHQSPYQRHQSTKLVSPVLSPVGTNLAGSRLLPTAALHSVDLQGIGGPTQDLSQNNQIFEYIHQQKLARQIVDDRDHPQFQHCALQQRQQQQQHFFGHSTMCSSPQNHCHPNCRSAFAYPNCRSPLAYTVVSSAQQQQVGATANICDDGWRQQNPSNFLGLAGFGNSGRYDFQGHCVQRDTVSYVHSHLYDQREGGQPSATSLKDSLAAVISAQQDTLEISLSKKNAPRHYSHGKQNRGVAIISRRKDNGAYGDGHIASPILDDVTVKYLMGVEEGRPQQSQAKFSTLEEVEGRIYDTAKDQHGCRFLQRKFDEGTPEDVQKIFQEISSHIVELMTDPFGNYLVQKLLEVCNEAQRMQILEVVTVKDDLVTISLNMHGTRAVQKLIDTLKTPDQVVMVISSLRQGVVDLIKDLNGNHVVQRCLQRFSSEDGQFIFDAAISHCVEIASHRHGCCVLQRCVDFASEMQRECLVAEIAANSLILSQDPFGSKHIEVHYHFIRDRLQAGEVELHYVPSSENVANIFTKPLSRELHLKHMEQLCVMPMQAMRGGVGDGIARWPFQHEDHG